jgi:hypothetical protein
MGGSNGFQDIGLHVEVTFSGFSFFADFNHHGADQSQGRRLVREQRRETSATFDLFVDTFEHVRRAQEAAVSRRQHEHGEAFMDVRFDPVGQLRGRIDILRDRLLQQAIRFVLIRRIEDGSDVGGDLFSHRHLRHVRHRVLLKTKLTSLPWDARESSFASCLEPFVIVADDQLHTVQAAILQRGEELSPMNFGLGKRDADAEH